MWEMRQAALETRTDPIAVTIQDQTKPGRTVAMNNLGGISALDVMGAEQRRDTIIPESKVSASSHTSKTSRSGLAKAVLDGLLALAATTSTMTLKDNAGGLRKSIETA